MGFADKLISRLNDADVVKFSEKDIFKDVKTWIHSGSPEMESNMTILGFPVGVTEIAGKSRSGKTTIALMAMKNFQKSHPDGVCLILSSENRDNKEYAKQIGIDVEKVIIVKSKFVEDLFFKLQIQLNAINKLWAEEGMEGKPKVFIFWDSLGSTLSRSEKEAFNENVKNLEKSLAKGTKMDIEHSQPGAFAKQAKMCMKNLLSQIYDMDIVFLILNHTMAKIGGGRGGRTSGGGEWIEYMPTLRLETTLIENEKIDDVEVAQYTKVKVVKNDFGPRKETIIEILLGYGIVLSEEDIKYALDQKILVPKGKTGVSFMNDKLTWNSKRSFYQNYYDSHPLLPVLLTKIKNARHKDILAKRALEEEEE